MEKQFKKFLLKDPLKKKSGKGKIVTIAGVAGIVIAAGILFTRKRKDGSTLLDDMITGMRGLADQAASYGTRLKDRLLHHIKGPNGEDVFTDMYNRLYYVNDEEKRVYLDND